jgi:hypothetical protein
VIPADRVVSTDEVVSSYAEGSVAPSVVLAGGSGIFLS